MITRLNKVDINYERITPESISDESTVVLFLHEALGSIGQWKQFPQELCDKLGLEGIVYERQGHGKSSPFTQSRKADYLHKYALEELPEFIEAVIPDKKILLVGHSDGGTIALLYASEHAENIAGIVTMAAHVINEPETVAGIDPAVKAYQNGKLDGLKKYHGDKTEALFYAWANIWRNDSFQNWDITDEISSPSLNGLFIQGADDQYGTEKQLELIEENFTGESKTLMITECGHHPHLEQKERVISQISEWQGK